MASKTTVSTTQMRKHWQMLCEGIGNRECGSANEQRAADYIEGQFNRFGLGDVHQHHFDFPFGRCTKFQVKVRPGSRGRWRPKGEGTSIYRAARERTRRVPTRHGQSRGPPR